MIENTYWNAILRHRLHRRRAIASVAAGSATALFLAACGGGNSKSDGGGSKLVTKAADSLKQAKKGGVYKSSRSNDIDHSDPFFTTQAAPGTAEVYARLFRRAPGYLTSQPVEYIGDLAESWEFSPDKLNLTVKLKNGHWHTIAPVNGRAVEASDVVYTWGRLEAVSANRGLLSNKISPAAPIQSITAVDKSTVSIKLAYPAATVIPMLSGNISGYLWILPKESEGYDPRRVTIGCGPWMVSEYVPSAKINFKRNPGYHDADAILIDAYEQPIVLEYANGLAQFKAGSIYGPAGVRGFVVNPTDVLQTKREVPAINLYVEDPPAMSEFAFFGWNPALGNGTPFRDKRLRQAFSMSVDRNLWIDTFYETDKFKAEGIPMVTPWNSVLTTNWPGWWLDPQGKELGAAAKNYQFDLAEAKKLVSAAGLPPTQEIKAQYPLTGYSADYLKHVEVMINFAKEAGIKMVTSPVSFTTEWRPKVSDNGGDFEGISFRPDATAGLPHPVEFMYAGFHHEAGAGYTGFFPSSSSFQKGDPRLDDILNKARREFDDKKQQAGIAELQKIVADEMYVVRMPGSSNSFTMAWPVVRNQKVWDGDTTLRNMWLDPSKKPLGQEG
jgi:ABC-type transport system substrate-binding protein